MKELSWNISNDFESQSNLRGERPNECNLTIHDVMHYIRSTDKFFHPLGVGFYALDCNTGKYLYVSKNFEKISGYKSVELFEGGVNKWRKIIHPDDRARVFMSMEKEANIILNDYQQRYYVFNGSYRIISSHGSIKQICQQSTIYKSASNLLEMGMITEAQFSQKEISHPVNEERKDKISGQSEHPATTVAPLSEREREIDNLLGRRYSSKQIATNLNISLHTVNAHRRKINEKKYSDKTVSPLVRMEKMKIVK